MICVMPFVGKMLELKVTVCGAQVSELVTYGAGGVIVPSSTTMTPLEVGQRFKLEGMWLLVGWGATVLLGL